MPTFGDYGKSNWKAKKALRDTYRKKLIAKGVLDGSTKMRTLMARKIK